MDSLTNDVSFHASESEVDPIEAAAAAAAAALDSNAPNMWHVIF